MGQVAPQGVTLAAFKAPTTEERAHDFLWRIHPRLPQPGMIRVFDRSHYEDLLVPTAAALAGEPSEFAAGEDELNRRSRDIHEMEVEAIRSATGIVKISWRSPTRNRRPAFSNDSSAPTSTGSSP